MENEARNVMFQKCYEGLHDHKVSRTVPHTHEHLHQGHLSVVSGFRTYQRAEPQLSQCRLEVYHLPEAICEVPSLPQ